MTIPAAIRVPSLVAVSLGIGAISGWYAHGRFRNEGPVSEAHEAYRQGKVELALRLAHAVLRTSGGNHPDAQRIIARCLASQQKWGEAAKAFDQAISKTPEDFALHARSLYSLGRIDQALAVLETGLKTFPSDPRLSELETRALATYFRAKEALASAERLMAIPGKELSGRVLAGMIHYDTRNYRQAAKQLREAIAMDPDLEGQSPDFPKTPPDLVNELIAASLLQTDRAGEALEFARAAYDAKPSLARAVLAADAAAARKAWPEVRTWADRALKFDPDDVGALVLSVDASLEQGAVPDAEQAVQKLSKLGRQDPTFTHKLNLARARVAAARRLADARSKRE